jgi:hypothetical protein
MEGARVTSPILSNLDGLIGLSRLHGVDINPTLLRVLTDLYVQKPFHSPDEESQYTTLALRLLDKVDPDTSDIVGRKLAGYAGAPDAVLRRLFGDAPEAIRTAQAQVGRTTASEQAARASRPADAARPRYVRRSAAASELTALFFAADSTERRLILANLQYADAIVSPRKPRGDVDAAIRELETSALAGRPEQFIRVLERTLGLSRAIAERIVNDPFGEPIVVAAKALDMPLPVLQRILLFVNPAVGHSVKRVYDLSALFQEISPDSAFHLVSLWRAPHPDQPRAPHRPVSFDDEMRRVRDAAAPGARLGTIDDDDDLFLDRVQRTS